MLNTISSELVTTTPPINDAIIVVDQQKQKKLISKRSRGDWTKYTNYNFNVIIEREKWLAK